MNAIGLMYVGAVLFLNSLMLLGYISSKSAGIFNLFIGALQVFTPIYLIMTAYGDQHMIINAAGSFLFGFTYTYVGITNLSRIEQTGVGWYSLWVAILAIGFSITNIAYYDDVKMGMIWILWSFLWTLFFLSMGLNWDMDYYTGWITMIESWITATIPGFLQITKIWEHTPMTIAWSVFILAVLVFIALIFIVRPKARVKEATSGS